MAINIERSREIYETRDYDQFVYEKGNRDLDTAHAENIIKSMQLHGNLMDVYPIVVQRAKQKKKDVLVVKDGQHRLEAAMRLRLSVFYTIDTEERLSLQTIIDANAAQKSWTLRDFLGSYCIRDYAEYLRVREYITMYPVPITTALQLLSTGDGKSLRLDFKRGVYRVTNWEWGCTVGDALRDFSGYIAYAHSVQFIAAVTYLLRNEGYDHGQMLHKLSIGAHVNIVERASNADAYFEQLEAIYNYKQQAKSLAEFRMIDSTGRIKKAGRWIAEHHERA